MHSTFLFSCIMTMISNLTILCIIQISIFNFFFTNITDFWIFIWFLCSFFNNFISFFLKLIIFLACFLKDEQNLFIQPLLLYILCIVSIIRNEDNVEIKKPDEICLLTFVVDEFSELFLHQSIFFYFFVLLCRSFFISSWFNATVKHIESICYLFYWLNLLLLFYPIRRIYTWSTIILIYFMRFII